MATGQEGTATTSHEEPAPKVPKLHPFTTLLYDISNEINDDGLNDLKYLCQDLIEKRSLEKIKHPRDLFALLRETGMITETHPELLQDLLCYAGLATLSERVQAYNAGQSSNEAASTDKERKLVKYLKKQYKGHFSMLQPIPWNDDLKLKLKEVYTRLEVKEVHRGSLKTGNDLKHLHDMFKISDDEEHARRIRIEGPPAMGKSTLCRKIAYDWACGEIKEHKYDLLFFLEMRHVTASSVVDEIFNQLLPKDIGITKGELESIILTNIESVLFLFDGLDEIAKEKIESSDIADHIQGRVRQYCTIVTTTRPRLCDKYLSECDLFLVVKGFTQKSTNEYIQKYFKDDPDAGTTLVKETKEQRSDVTKKVITDLLRNPLHVSFLCILWEDHKLHEKENKFPQTLTELYSEVLECILMRFCVKKSIALRKGEIPREIIHDRDELASDSCEVYLEKRSNFEREDISSPRSLDLGLLVRDLGHSRTKAKEMYFFYHKTWLEYFTALHVSLQLKEGNAGVLDTLIDNVQTSKPVLIFLAGISGYSESELLFKMIRDKIQTLKEQRVPNSLIEKQKSLFSKLYSICFECFYESRHGVTCISIIDSVVKESVIKFGKKNETRDIGYFYVEFKDYSSMCRELFNYRWISVQRGHCNLEFILNILKQKPGLLENLEIHNPTYREIAMLAMHVKNSERNVVLKHLGIYIEHARNTEKVVDKLSEMIKSDEGYAGVQSLKLEFYDYNDDFSVEALRTSLLQMLARIAQHGNIETFSFHLFEKKPPFSDLSFPIFDEFLQKGPREVCFSTQKWHSDESLYNLIKKSTTTESIQLYLYAMDNEMYLELSRALNNPSSCITSFGLFTNEFKVDCAFLDTLATNNTLHDISLGDFTDESISGACDLIQRNMFAQSLTLYVNDINNQVCQKMITSLKENRSLKHFTVIEIFFGSGISYVLSNLAVPVVREMETFKSQLKSLTVIARGRKHDIDGFISKQSNPQCWSYRSSESHNHSIGDPYYCWYKVTYSNAEAAGSNEN